MFIRLKMRERKYIKFVGFTLVQFWIMIIFSLLKFNALT